MAESKQQTSKSGPTYANRGAFVGLLMAVLMLGYALSMLFTGSDQPMPLQIAFLVAGVVEGAVCYLTLRRNRAAWSFAVSLNGTLAVVFFFGATKVRDGFDVPLEVGFIPCVVLTAITTHLAWDSDKF